MQSSPFQSGNHAPVDDELDRDDLPIDGVLPAELDGTLYRNGANPRLPPIAPYHPFTGDGMVHAVRLRGGRASYRNRWVRTTRFEAERAAGRPLFAGFGRPVEGTPPALDNGVANTHVLMQGGRLLALEEAHAPVRLDPATLATLGPERFGGGFAGRFAAHPKRDPDTGTLVFFAYGADGPFSPVMRWGEVDGDGVLRREERFAVPYCSMTHDFGVTATHVAIPVLPLTGSLERARAGGPPFAWDAARDGFVGVMRRDAGAASLRWCPIGRRFAFHVMNAFDATDGTVALDVVEYDRAPLFPDADGAPAPPSVPSCLARWAVDPTGARPFARTVLDEDGGEFPRIDERWAGLPYTVGFRLGRPEHASAPPDAILRHALDRGTRRMHRFAGGESPSEPVFVPKSDDAPEGDGWLLLVVWRPATDDSALVVLDAALPSDGPIATVTLPRRVPFGFHGSWVGAPDDG